MRELGSRTDGAARRNLGSQADAETTWTMEIC